MHARDDLILSVHDGPGRPSERSRSLGPCGRGSSAIFIERNEHSDLFQEIFHMFYALKNSAHLSEM